MLKIVNGCLIEALEKGEIDALAHCVNNIPRMSSGLGAIVKDKYPDDYTFYLNHTKILLDSRYNPLGRLCTLNKIINLYGQSIDLTEYCKINNIDINSVYKRPKLVKYWALYKALRCIKFYKHTKNKYIGIPYGLGCGLAGGKWFIVKWLIIIALWGHLDKITIYKKVN